MLNRPSVPNGTALRKEQVELKKAQQTVSLSGRKVPRQIFPPPLSQSPVGLLYTDLNSPANFFAFPPELFRPHLHSICLMFTAYRSHSLSIRASEPRCLTVVITTMMSWSTFKQALGERTFCYRERRTRRLVFETSVT